MQKAREQTGATAKASHNLTAVQTRRALLQAMPRMDQLEYKFYVGSIECSVHPGTVLVVYTLRGEGPRDVAPLRITHFDYHSQLGPRLTACDSQGSFDFGLVPTRYRSRRLFLAISQEIDLRLKGQAMEDGSVGVLPIISVCLRTESPEGVREIGHTYCMPLMRFRKTWPAVDVELNQLVDPGAQDYAEWWR